MFRDFEKWQCASGFSGGQTPIDPSWIAFAPETLGRSLYRHQSAFAGLDPRRKAGNCAQGIGIYTWARKHIHKLHTVPGSTFPFVDEVKKQCADMDAQWDERQKTRAEETEAISKAVEILDAAEAHENFAKTFSFLQESKESSRVSKAAAALAKAKDPRVLSLAMQMKIDKFTNVKKAMDDMVFALKKEQADEVKQKDFCVEEFRKNQLQTEDKTRTKEALLAKEQAIDIAKPKSDIETLESEIADMQKQLQLAGQNREKENAEFQKVIEEQRQTQSLLKEALTVLGKFYNKGAFLQGSQHAPEAPGGFKDYKANGKSFGVMSMLQQLVEDAKAMEAEAVRAENSILCEQR
eukprot:s179_g7.t1